METEMNSGCRMVDCMVCFTPNCDILRRARERRRYSFEHPAPGANEMAEREELARDWAEQTWSVGESGWIKLGRGRMRRVEEISLLKAEIEALAAERDRLREIAAGAVSAERDTLRQQLDESERQLTLWIKADNANREQLAAAKDHARMVVESWRQLKTVHAESPANHAVPLALLLAHVGMLAGDSDRDAYLFLAALNRTMLAIGERAAAVLSTSRAVHRLLEAEKADVMILSDSLEMSEAWQAWLAAVAAMGKGADHG